MRVERGSSGWLSYLSPYTFFNQITSIFWRALQFIRPSHELPAIALDTLKNGRVDREYQKITFDFPHGVLERHQEESILGRILGDRELQPNQANPDFLKMAVFETHRKCPGLSGYVRNSEVAPEGSIEYSLTEVRGEERNEELWIHCSYRVIVTPQQEEIQIFTARCSYHSSDLEIVWDSLIKEGR